MFKLLNLDVVNIILMLLSAVIAFFIPFELFLFVFAFLGPLHYLTEINWLHTKNYYTTAKNDYLLLVFILFIVGISIFSPLAVYFKKFLPILIAFAFFSAFGMQQFAKTKAKNVYYVIVLGISVLLFYFFTEKSEIIFSYLLPTLIHVFIFTGLFILVGALKRDNSRKNFFNHFCTLWRYTFIRSCFFNQSKYFFLYNHFVWFFKINKSNFNRILF